MKEFDQLFQLVKHLRIHCPWDRKQKFSDMGAHVTEEVEEVCQALEKEDWENLKEELGDTFFNLLFITNLAEEQNHFNLENVLVASHQKMVNRHPHVFGEVKANTAEEALEAFLEAKKKEKENLE